MRVVTEVTITNRHVCPACIDSEDARPGAVCTCIESPLELEVVGDVNPGTAQVLESISILSIQDDTGHTWNHVEIDSLSQEDNEAILDALWEAHLDRVVPQALVREKAEKLCKAIETQVRWALEVQNTSTEKVQAWLDELHEAVRRVRKEAA